MWNLQAASSERKRARAEADRVDAVAVAIGGNANGSGFALDFVVTNNGAHDLRIGTPRVEPVVFTLGEVLRPGVIGNGTSAQVTLNLHARCPVPSTVKIRAVIPVSPPSGRVVDIPGEPDVSLVDNLAHRACGEIPPFDAAQISSRYTGSSTYGVTFTLTVTNGTPDPAKLVGIVSPGLAVGVRGGTPVDVPANDRLVLRVEVSLPACSRLPSGRDGAQRYGSFQVAFRDAQGAVRAAQYVPEPREQLYPALLALRARTCPGSAPAGTRSRGF